jgi:predicted phage terminase large subunit-like protein
MSWRVDNLEKRVQESGKHLNVRGQTSKGNKRTRIEGLEPLIAQGRLLFSRQHDKLLEQLRQFPLGAHDDGPDALEMAVRASIHGGQRAWNVWLPWLR